MQASRAPYLAATARTLRSSSWVRYSSMLPRFLPYHGVHQAYHSLELCQVEYFGLSQAQIVKPKPMKAKGLYVIQSRYVEYTCKPQRVRARIRAWKHQSDTCECQTNCGTHWSVLARNRI